MTTQPATHADASSGRDGLVQCLTLESRNALARVELAASELRRFDGSPAMAGLLDTIGEAVGELDGLLARIGLLGTRRIGIGSREIALDSVVGDVVERLRPTLRARGVELVQRGGAASCELPCLPATLERLVFGFLRLALGMAAPGMSWVLTTRSGEGGVVLALSVGGAEPLGLPALHEAEHRLELELQLAELGARLSAGGCSGRELVLEIPVADGAGEGGRGGPGKCDGAAGEERVDARG